MKKSADQLIKDLASTIAYYESAADRDRELGELYQVAEATMNMLVVIRRHQIGRRAGDAPMGLDQDVAVAN